MTQVQPIPEELWGALNHVIGYAKYKARTFTDADYEYVNGLTDSIKLLEEYTGCFTAEGKISQRGEIPHCWNKDTIFTPHRMRTKHECLLEQPMLPFGETQA